MGIYQGVVQRVHVGDPQPPKQEGWSKSAKFGIQIADKWHNGFVSENRDGAFVVTDKDWREVKEGMEVQFMTIEKNGFENIDKKSIHILASGSNATTPAAQQPAPQGKVAGNASKDDRIAELEQRVCDGLAAMFALHKLSGKDMPNDDLLRRASDIIGKMFKQ